MRRAISLSMVVLAAMAVIGAGTAQAALDTSFGEGGVAIATPPTPAGWKNLSIQAAATGQNGETFLVARQNTCGGYRCSHGDFVFRYLADGALEPAFAGSRGWGIPPEATYAEDEGEDLITVDSSGMPVVGRTPSKTQANGWIVLRRLLSNGELDTGFGANGGLRLPCPCGEGNTELVAGPKNSTFVIATSVTREKRRGAKTGQTGTGTVIKLDSAGHREGAYGTRGSVTAQVPGEGEVEYVGLNPNGATYFGGRGLTKATQTGFLVKVKANGKIDGKFGKRAVRSLRRLRGLKGNEVRVTAVVAGRKGPVELFGSAGSIGGFELRLHPSGTLARGWGEKGLMLLSYPVDQAIQGREGSTMALAGGEGAPPKVLRILGSGKPDPVFGRSGEIMPGTTNGAGFSIFPAGVGRVGVVNIGAQACDGTCEPTPMLYRYLEGH